MIFLTTGTEKFPFNRLLQAVDTAIGSKEIHQDVWGQIGKSSYRPQWFSYKEFFEFDQMKKVIQEAQIVISHAGVGSTLLCLTLGKIPILFPRQKAFGEHLDDHQMEFAKRIEISGKVLVAYNEKDLIYKISHYQHLIGELQLRSTQNRKEELVTYLREIANGKKDVGDEPCLSPLVKD